MLTTLALMERQTGRFRVCEALKERSNEEIEGFRNEMNRKNMFYTISQF